MNILVISPMDSGKYKDDTEMFIEGFRKRGHIVTKTKMWFDDDKVMTNENVDELNFEQAEVIWAPYEPLIPVANELKKILNIPVVGHWEIVPPGRIPMDDVDKYWYTHDDFPHDENLLKLKWFYEYQHLAKEFIKCDVKSITCISEKCLLERLLGIKVPGLLFIKPYPLDTEMLDSYKIKDVQQKHQICSVLSLRPHKRPHHVIRALSLIKNPPKLVLLGDGPLKENLEKIAKDLEVEVEFKGTVNDEEKAKIMQESLLTVHPWACLPAGESVYLGRLSINYDELVQRGRLNNMATFVEGNNIPQLAETIKYFVENPEARKAEEERAYKELMEFKTHTLPINEACARVEEMFKLAISDWKAKK